MKSTNIIWLIVRSEIFCSSCSLFIIHVKVSTIYTVMLVLPILALAIWNTTEGVQLADKIVVLEVGKPGGGTIFSILCPSHVAEYPENLG